MLVEIAAFGIAACADAPTGDAAGAAGTAASTSLGNHCTLRNCSSVSALWSDTLATDG